MIDETYAENGETDKAIESFERLRNLGLWDERTFSGWEAAKLSQIPKNIIKAIDLLHEANELILEKQDYQSALTSLFQTLDLMDDSESNKAIVYNNIVYCYLVLGYYRTAHTYMKMANDIDSTILSRDVQQLMMALDYGVTPSMLIGDPPYRLKHNGGL